MRNEPPAVAERLSAIVLDDIILRAPVIEHVIGDSGQIRGARTLNEAQDLAINLRSGAPQAAIEIVQERTVESYLGADLAWDAGCCRGFGSCGDDGLWSAEIPPGRQFGGRVSWRNV